MRSIASSATRLAVELKDERAPGHIGWRELTTTDQVAALAFYSQLLGWKKDASHDMGPHGLYDLYSTEDAQRGGMMRGTSSWLFYFTVESVGAAALACTHEGGQLVSEPHQKPEGGWIARCRDPQGALFAVAGKQ